MISLPFYEWVVVEHIHIMFHSRTQKTLIQISFEIQEVDSGTLNTFWCVFYVHPMVVYSPTSYTTYDTYNILIDSVSQHDSSIVPTLCFMWKQISARTFLFQKSLGKIFGKQLANYHTFLLCKNP